MSCECDADWLQDCIDLRSAHHRVSSTFTGKTFPKGITTCVSALNFLWQRGYLDYHYHYHRYHNLRYHLRLLISSTYSSSSGSVNHTMFWIMNKRGDRITGWEQASLKVSKNTDPQTCTDLDSNRMSHWTVGQWVSLFFFFFNISSGIEIGLLCCADDKWWVHLQWKIRPLKGSLYQYKRRIENADKHALFCPDYIQKPQMAFDGEVTDVITFFLINNTIYGIRIQFGRGISLLYMLCESLFEQAVGLLGLRLSNYQGFYHHSRTQRNLDRHPYTV